MFTLDSCPQIDINLHHPKHFPVACRKNRTIGNTPRQVEPSQCRELNTNKYSVEDLDAFSYMEHLENIAGSENQYQQNVNLFGSPM
jgi:hypothetical protein